MVFAVAIAVTAFLLHEQNVTTITFPFSISAILGSALAIFIAFRNNSSYSRWWEARTLWGSIINSSRVLARLIITFTDSHAHQQNYEKARSEQFKKEMIYKVIAWAHVLRLHLRNQDYWQGLKAFLSEQEFENLIKSQNKPNFIHLISGKKIYEAMANGTLGGFDSFQMEGQLLALANYQGGCERIKNTPLLRQYDFFTRVFLYAFMLLLPFSLIGDFTKMNIAYMMIPVSIIISFVFAIIGKVGEVNEDPFENRITDVPLTDMCNTIERDLREMLGETDLPIRSRERIFILMSNLNQIPTSRIEAFSDGVIAIIISVMVFDLKLQEIPTDKTVWSELLKLAPKFISYAISYLMLAIMWVNHHQLFHQIKHTDRKLLWYSIHLLFWMSIIPFGTNFIGANSMLWQASFIYGIIFFMSAMSFTILRNYVLKNNLLHDSINKQSHIKIRNKNRVALSIYLLASIVSIVSVYVSFALFLVVPAMYFIPENISHTNQSEK